jgi:hypothetical protein
MVSGTSDGFPEIEEQIHSDAGPDPPHSEEYSDPPHCEDNCDPPYWEKLNLPQRAIQERMGFALPQSAYFQ